VRQALAGQRRNGRTAALEEMVIDIASWGKFKLRHYRDFSRIDGQHGHYRIREGLPTNRE
jgi:hypothetical protein